MSPERVVQFTPLRRMAFSRYFLIELAEEIERRREVLPEGQRRCIRCRRVLPDDREHFDTRNICKECHRARMREYERTYYHAHRERYRKYFEQRRARRREEAAS